MHFIASGTITCQIDSPDRDECIKEAIQDMLPKLVVCTSFSIWINSFTVKFITKLAGNFNFERSYFYKFFSSNCRTVCKAFIFHQLTHMWWTHKQWPSDVEIHSAQPVPFVKLTFMELQRLKLLMLSKYF